MIATDRLKCPSCSAALDTGLRCGTCGRRFALVAADEPITPEGRLLDSLGLARNDAERAALRSQLSRLFAEQRRHDVLLGLWADESGPEADLWRGAAAVLAQPAGSDDPVEPLERALVAFLEQGRRDMAAVARAYLIQAYLSAMRVHDAEHISDAALAAAIEERDSTACVRVSSTRYLHIAYEYREQYRLAAQHLERIAQVVRPWAPAQAAVIQMMRAAVTLRSDPAAARDLVASLPEPDAATRTSRERQALRFAANEAVLAQDSDAAERALAGLVEAPMADDSELPLFAALTRGTLALISGDPRTALVHARAGMPPPWHRACARRSESRLLTAEALARLLPHDAMDRRRRAAARAIHKADRFRAAGIFWREMRWRLLAGELLRSAGERKSAARELLRARAVADRLGLERAREGIAAHLRALGVGAPRRSVGPLTSRETEIARLIATGATNADIAATLVLSQSTVARHVSNILMKLDLPNRRAIAARLQRAGARP